MSPTRPSSGPLLLTVGAAFLRRGLLEAASYRAAWLVRLFGWVLALASLLFFARFIDAARAPLAAGPGYFGFALIGIVMLNLQHAVVSSYPRAIRAAQLEGTLEAMLATPTPSWMILLCAPLYPIVAALLGAVVVLACAAAFLPPGTPSPNLPLLGITWLLALCAYAALGFFAATITMVLRRSDPLTLFLGSVSTLAGGVLYPTEVLPQWLQALGYLLPIRPVLELSRAALWGPASAASGLITPLAALTLFCACALPLGLGAFASMVKRARYQGSLSHY